MKTLFYVMMSVLLIIFQGCKKKDTPPTNPGGTTIPTNPNTGNGTGKAFITCFQCQCFVDAGQGNVGCVYHSFGLGYSSTDVANQAFFQRTSPTNQLNDTYWFTLPAGVYYYGGTALNHCNDSQQPCTACGYTGNGSKTVNGSFTIVANQTTQVAIGF